MTKKTAEPLFSSKECPLISEAGLKLSASDITSADARRTQLYQRILNFFERFDFLELRSTQVQPFAVETEWVTQIGGHKLSSYLDWMAMKRPKF